MTKPAEKQSLQDFLGLGSLTRGHILVAALFVSGGGYSVNRVEGRTETITARVATLEDRLAKLDTTLAVIQAQGVQNQKELDEVHSDLRELTRALYRNPRYVEPSGKPPQ